MKRIASLLCVLISVSASGPTAIAADRQMDLTAAETRHRFSVFDADTAVWAYNRTIPGPVIRMPHGSTLTVNFINRLTEASTIHWHGLRFDNAMDGVPGVTQPPVAPGGTFTYRLRLNDPGTFWYHPHLNAGEQLERGLKGVLIVNDPEPLPWSQDLVLLLDDWRFTREGQISPHFNTHHDLMHDGRWGNLGTINGNVDPEFPVTPGERLRLRLVNGANARIFTPRFKGLSASVIAVDGRPVDRPFPLYGFTLSPGNRIDLDVVIPPDSGERRFLLEDVFTRNPHRLGALAVTGAKPVPTPEFAIPSPETFLPAKSFRSVAVSKTWDLNAVRGGRFGIGWAMNHRLWPNPDGADFPIDQPQKLVFANSSTRLHPMHIHGVFFRVLERNGQPAVEPFTRDTVLVGPRETVVIGLIPRQKGIWVTHCHIQEHAEAGMMTQIEVTPE